MNEYKCARCGVAVDIAAPYCRNCGYAGTMIQLDEGGTIASSRRFGKDGEWYPIPKNHLTVDKRDEKQAAEAVNHPAHYQGKHECIEVMRAMFGDDAVKHFCMCNSFKYRFRAAKKNGEEDIKKAEFYENYIIEELESKKHD